MNFKHLHYFWWVTKADGGARVSEQLHLTPQAISGEIGLLEDDLGTPLFAKSDRKLELTGAGRCRSRFFFPRGWIRMLIEISLATGVAARSP